MKCQLFLCAAPDFKNEVFYFASFVLCASPPPPNCLGNDMTEEVFSNHFFRLSDSPARGGAGLLELLGPRDHSGTTRL